MTTSLSAREDLIERAKDTALRKLSFSQKTEKEIRDFLKEKEFDEDSIEEAVSFLKEYRYIDDGVYAATYYRLSKRKNKADKRIFKELNLKGISDSVIREGLEENLEEEDYVDDKKLAMEVGLKLLNQRLDEGLEVDEKFLNKVGRRLLTLGYTNSIAIYVMNSLRRRDD